MILFEVEEVLKATQGSLIRGEIRRRGFHQIQTDSRRVKRGDLFLALQGQNFDGHDFLAHACGSGAYGVVIDEARAPEIFTREKTTFTPRLLVIGVRDTLWAYQELARYHRARFSIPIIAITGSNGKTTTKEMVSQVLSTRWRIHKTTANFNNAIGVPRTILALRSRVQAAVVEMGVDQVGQTDRLCEIAQPTLGVITNVGPDHLESYGTMANSAASKGELLKWLSPKGTAVLNADDPYFSSFTRQARSRVVSFGLSEKADVQAKKQAWNGLQTTFELWLPRRTRGRKAVIRALGTHNISNALAGAGVGYALGFSMEKIVEGLGKFRPAPMRSEVFRRNGVTFIYDCYNANPASVKAALDLLVNVDADRRTIAVLGDMLELGPQEETYHQDIGKFAAKKKVSQLIACGNFAPMIEAGTRQWRTKIPVTVVKNAVEAGHALKNVVKRGDIVLIKASRGMRMEQVLDPFSIDGDRCFSGNKG